MASQIDMTGHNDEALERSLGQLVADATHDISSIVRSEVTLAKAEVGADAKKAVAGAGLFVARGPLVPCPDHALDCSANGLVAAGLAPWLASLIVAGVCCCWA